MSWNSSRLSLLPSHTHTPSFKLAFLLAWILQPEGEEAHSSCKNGFVLQEEEGEEEEEAHGVRMLCFAGEIVGESGSAMVGMPASCNSEGLAALALWNCPGVHPSLWVSILSVCLSVFCFFLFCEGLRSERLLQFFFCHGDYCGQCLKNTTQILHA